MIWPVLARFLASNRWNMYLRTQKTEKTYFSKLRSWPVLQLDDTNIFLSFECNFVRSMDVECHVDSKKLKTSKIGTSVPKL